MDLQGKRVACGTKDAKIILVSAKTGKPLRTIKGHRNMISDAAFVENGKRLISSSWDCTTRIWNGANGAQEKRILKHESEVKALAVDSESSKGAAGARDGEVKIFSLSSLKCIRNLQAHKLDISGLAFTSDGSKLVTASWDGSARLWDLSSYDPIRTLARQKERIRSMTLAPDDSRVFLGLHGGRILSVNLDDPRDTAEIAGHTDIVTSLSVDTTGTRLLSGSWDRTIRVFSLENGTQEIMEKSWTGVSSVGWGKRNTVYSAHISGSLVAWTP